MAMVTTTAKKNNDASRRTFSKALRVPVMAKLKPENIRKRKTMTVAADMTRKRSIRGSMLVAAQNRWYLLTLLVVSTSMRTSSVKSSESVLNVGHVSMGSNI